MARAILFALLLSAGIETAQRYIPGRHPNPGDVLFNVTGAAVGALLWFHLERRGRRLVRWREVHDRVAVSIVLVAFAGGIVLLGPAPDGDRRLAISAAPAIPGIPTLPGRILTLRIDGASIPASGVPPGNTTIPLPRATAPVEVEVEIDWDARPDGNSPIVRIRDFAGADWLTLAADGDALVLRSRTRGAALRLDRPDLRAEGIFTDVEPGTRTQLIIRRSDRAFCVTVDDAPDDCTLAFTAGDQWGVLFYPRSFRRGTRAALGALWMLIAGAGFGILAGTRRNALLAGTGLALVLLLIPPTAGIAPTPILQLAAAALGFSLARTARRHHIYRKEKDHEIATPAPHPSPRG